mmetsp:Transcript_16115/g.17911  ORF Transcript_16115/g.17911 Transcript_16115/m.17911 type:complete len:279 (-) Transcript_16115:60-896(-)
MDIPEIFKEARRRDNQHAKDSFELIRSYVEFLLEIEEPHKRWETINWETDASTAVSKAKASNKFLIVENCAMYNGDANCPIACLGARVLRCSILSDPQVIDVINREFIALKVNLTTDGFPKDLDGLNGIRQLYKQESTKTQRNHHNLAILSPNGEHRLGDIDTYRHTFIEDLSYEYFNKTLVSARERWRIVQETNKHFERFRLWEGVKGVARLTKEGIAEGGSKLKAVAILASRARAANFDDEAFHKLEKTGLLGRYLESQPTMSNCNSSNNRPFKGL